MTWIYPTEYVITLNTREVLKISEFDPDVIQDLNNTNVASNIEYVTRHCSYMTREIIEEAKLGYTKRFQNSMRTPPVGALLKLERPLCGLRSECSLWDPKKCSTRNVGPRIGKFPICWESEFPESISGDILIRAKSITHSIIHAWREGSYVIIIS